MTSRHTRLARWATILGMVATFLSPGHALAQQPDGPSVSLVARFEQSLLPKLQIDWLCSSGEVKRQAHSLDQDQDLDLAIPDFVSGNTQCQVLARIPAGYTVEYTVAGDSTSQADRNGCQFSGITSGHRNSCRLVVSQQPVRLTVYKEWIGPSGEEEDVQISLKCESGEYSGYRFINDGSPDGWDIRQVDPEGILCNVSETVRDSFRPDIIDCQGLWILPGKGDECTLVNTKIVKRIEMLNRYGKIVMIVLVLGVGLVAAKRFA